MPDISDFHPFVQEALRTGRIPDNEALACALGKEPDEIARLRELLENEDETDDPPDPPDPDEQRFRDRYHQLVDAMTTQWLDEHPEYVKPVPAGVRERIEDDCNRQIQHAWRRHRQQRMEEEEDTDW